MNIKRISAALFAVIILISALSVTVFAAGALDSATAQQLAEKMVAKTYISTTKYELNYRIYYSPTYSSANTDKPAMLILYFHGEGGKGNDNTAQLNEKGLLNQLVSDGADALYKDFQYIIVAPQCPVEESFTEESSESQTVPTQVMNAVMELAGEIEATEIILEKHLVAGIGTGANAAFDYAARKTSKVNRLLTVGGSCTPAKTAQVYDAGVDFFVFAEESNTSIKNLSASIKLLSDVTAPITFVDGTFDDCLDYALSYTEPTIADWAIKDTYTSRRFKISTSCNNEGGKISASPASVTYGSGAKVTLTLNQGYAITKVTINGVEKDASIFESTKSNKRQYICKLNNITTNQSVSVELSRVTTESERGDFIDGLIVKLSIASAVLVLAAIATLMATYFYKKSE